MLTFVRFKIFSPLLGIVHNALVGSRIVLNVAEGDQQGFTDFLFYFFCWVGGGGGSRLTVFNRNLLTVRNPRLDTDKNV